MKVGRGSTTALASLLALGAWAATPAYASYSSALVSSHVQLRLAGAPGGVGSVSPAGDTNGDGVPDLLVGAPRASYAGRTGAGDVYVVFGRRAPDTVDLAHLGAGGFVIHGPSASLPFASDDEQQPQGDHAGAAVAALGDVNGDGLADVAVGVPYSSANLRLHSGSVFVVFGKTSTAPVDLDAVGDGGYRIDGARVGDELGAALAGPGDVNGDGRADALVGGTTSGAYVVFGKGDSSTVELDSLDGGGFRIVIPGGGSTAVAAGGDINGDGLADLLVGDEEASPLGRQRAGAAYAVFGSASTADVSVDALGARGYRIDGAYRGEALGAGVAPAGDFNGDGRPDLLVSIEASEDLPPPESASAHVYVVFGKPDVRDVDLQRGTTGALRVDGERVDDLTGAAIAGIGDVNGDGLGDVALGAPEAPRACLIYPGSVYVVYGRRTGGRIVLGQLGRAGYRLDGDRQGEQAGADLAAVGDLTGDGAPDLVTTAALGHDPLFQSQPSTALVVSGRPPPVRRGSPPTSRRCFDVHVLTRSLSELRRTRRLRVRVTAHGVGEFLDETGVEVVVRRGRATTFVGSALVSLRRRRTKTVVVRVEREALRLLRHRRRVRLRIRVGQGPYADFQVGFKTVTLRG